MRAGGAGALPVNAPFPWPWRGRENRSLSLVVLAWLLLLNAWGMLTWRLPALHRPSPWGAAAEERAPLFARLDSGWYDAIVRYGYGPAPAADMQSQHAVFPLYPSVARLVRLATGLRPYTACLLVTYASLLLAAPLFLEEARARFGPGPARRTLPFLLLFPPAFFLAAVYTESLFLLLALLAFRAIRRAAPGRAAAAGFLAGLTRAPAVALAPALALAAYRASPRTGSARLLAALLAGGAPVAGVAAWIFGSGVLAGEPLVFFRVMGAWGRSSPAAGSGPAAFAAEAAGLFESGHLLRHPGAALPYLHLVLALVLLVLQLRRGRGADAAWTASLACLPLLTGTAAGIPRYTLTVYPLQFALFETLDPHPRLRALWLAGCAALLLLEAAYFVNGHFVS